MQDDAHPTSVVRADVNEICHLCVQRVNIPSLVLGPRFYELLDLTISHPHANLTGHEGGCQLREIIHPPLDPRGNASGV